jgi:hypothetical protein
LVVAHPLPLPVATDDITADWLTAALRTRAPGVTVRRAETVDIKHGTCTKVRLRLEMDEAGQRAGIPRTIIVKGGFEPHSRDYYEMHAREARAYRDVFPAVELPTPACYFADFDADRRQGIVILEDLVARGVTFCDPRKPETHEQVAGRLTTLARYHARTWGAPDFAAGGRWAWAPDVSTGVISLMSYALAPQEWQRFVDSPRGAAVSVRFHDVAWMTDAHARMKALSAQLPHVVTHGDAHLGNFYVDPDGAPRFLDPVPCRAPAMTEIAYYVCGAMDTADRRRWEGALLGHYRDELERGGVTPPSFDEILRQYGLFLAHGFFLFMATEPYSQPEGLLTAYTARFSDAMLEHDTIGLLAALPKP